MNSEKVKEIKEVLECWQESVMLSTDENYVSHRVTNREILDYINELEKENAELLKENEGCHGSYRCAIDKIGELSAERYIKVKQFAERLKEKFYYEGRICRVIIDSDVFDETLKEFIDEN